MALFADDCTVICNSENKINDSLTFYLTININKTDIMIHESNKRV